MALNRTERDGDGDDNALRADLLAGVLYPRALDTTRDRVKTLESAQAPPLPQLSELGTRHVSGLSGDSTRDYTPLDEAIVRAVEKGKSTEVPSLFPPSLLQTTPRKESELYDLSQLSSSPPTILSPGPFSPPLFLPGAGETPPLRYYFAPRRSERDAWAESISRVANRNLLEART